MYLVNQVKGLRDVPLCEIAEWR